MSSVASCIQAIDAVNDVEVNLSGVSQALSAHSGREGDELTAMLSFVVANQVEKLKDARDWLEANMVD